MHNKIMYDSLCFLISILVFWFAYKYLYALYVKLVSKYKIYRRVYKMSHVGGSSSIMSDDESESIGLNKKGPVFGNNALFNFIANLNKDLINDMNELLTTAGLRQEKALEEFMRSKVLSAIMVFLMSLTITITYPDFDNGLPLNILISIAVGVLGGHYLTNLNVQMIADRRKLSIEFGVSDLVDLLVICTESGLDLNRAIRRIAREMRNSNPILAEELSLTSIELEMIADHKKVFSNLEARTNCLEIKTLSNTLSQSIDYGSSLSSSLKELAATTRQKRMLNAESKAAQVPTMLTLPMMLFIMPCLFIVMLGPVIVSMIKTFSASGM